jgi:cytochrome c oxidase subunit I+III
VFAYFYLWLGAEAWPPAGIALTGWGSTLLALALLLACAGAAQAALHAQRVQRPGRAGLAWAATLALGAAFLVVHALALAGPIGAPQVHAYASVAWTLAGFHGVHVVVAMLAAGFAWARLRGGHADARHTLDARIAAGLWHYAVAQGAVAWAVIHLFPRLA